MGWGKDVSGKDGGRVGRDGKPAGKSIWGGDNGSGRHRGRNGRSDQSPTVGKHHRSNFWGEAIDSKGKVIRGSDGKPVKVDFWGNVKGGGKK